MRRCRLCHHALDHLFLQHEVLIQDSDGEPEQMEQDRCRNVVGQVADNAQRRAGAGYQCFKIDLQHVGFYDRQASFPTQALRQIPVQLNDSELTEPFHQRLGQGAQARPDLHHRLTRPRSDKSDDFFNNAGVHQKVLTEAFARQMPGRHGHLSARRLTHLHIGAGPQLLRPDYKCFVLLFLTQNAADRFADFALA